MDASNLPGPNKRPCLDAEDVGRATVASGEHSPGGSGGGGDGAAGSAAAVLAAAVEPTPTAASAVAADMISILDFRLAPPPAVQAWLAERMPAALVRSTLAELPRPRRVTSLRVNTLATDRGSLVRRISGPLAAAGFVTAPHPLLPDCIVIHQRMRPSGPGAESSAATAAAASATAGGGGGGGSNGGGALAAGGAEDDGVKTVLVDKGCGEALLRGADLFAKGVRGLSTQIHVGDSVRVLVVLDELEDNGSVEGNPEDGATVNGDAGDAATSTRANATLGKSKNKKKCKKKTAAPRVPRASNVSYFAGVTKVFIGVGTAAMTSVDMRRASGAGKDVQSGVAVQMTEFLGGAAPSFERLKALAAATEWQEQQQQEQQQQQQQQLLLLQQSEEASTQRLPEPEQELQQQVPDKQRPEQFFAQNICSMVASHVLAPRRGDAVLDMCAAPGGKSSHLAALMENDGTLVCCERGRGKTRRLVARLAGLGITCARVCKLDSGNPVAAGASSGDGSCEGGSDGGGEPAPPTASAECAAGGVGGGVGGDEPVAVALQDVVDPESSPLAVRFAAPGSGGRKVTKQERRRKGGGGDDGSGSLVYYNFPKRHQFAPGSFDRVLLDPPCSALGLRPRLAFDSNDTSVVNLEFLPRQQRHFLSNAVALCKPGGVIVYSTCTFSPEENERVVAWALTEFAGVGLRLAPALPQLGDPGLPACGLDAAQCAMVQRFSPLTNVIGGRASAATAAAAAAASSGSGGDAACAGQPRDGPGGFFIAKFVKGDPCAVGR